ncbi:AAA family ATPase [Selenomonadales bacterium OttesenSCG-928-I06]|nr:AAA family ATPase [Selenomonadales bacterium OttesenSCG-928-I06]
MKHKEIIIGITIAVLVFLTFNKVDIMPLLFFGIMLGIFFYLVKKRSVGAKFAQIQSNKNTINLISFDDIGGQDVAKGELKEALEFLTDIDRLKTLGIRPLKGILLNGPPGTGKTLLAKAAAKFTNASFISASGSEFVEMYVGVGAQRVRQLFKQAKDSAKKFKANNVIIFLDEIEVLGGKRGANLGHLEYDQTLNELLVQMDGLSFEDEIRILVIGATNRVDMLDPALLRPGRFDRQVRVDLPDKKGRLKILELHTKNKPLAADVSLQEIATDTFGFSGAHLESVANEAAILAFRDGLETIQSKHLRMAIEKVILGEKLERKPNEEEIRRIAIHEIGHAFFSEYLNKGSVASISISSRGRALGYVRQTQEEDIYLYTEDYIRGKIDVAIAGSIAEEIYIGSLSTGALEDFKQAANLAKQIVCAGMSELGIVSSNDIPQTLLHKTITELIKREKEYVKNTLSRELSPLVLKEILEILLNKEVLSGREFREIFLNKKIPKSV